jgi:hypothetical protein
MSHMLTTLKAKGKLTKYKRDQGYLTAVSTLFCRSSWEGPVAPIEGEFSIKSGTAIWGIELFVIGFLIYVIAVPNHFSLPQTTVKLC